jgi:hypothetical protein
MKIIKQKELENKISSNECKLCCMDRDINASKNILLLLQCEKQDQNVLGNKENKYLRYSYP